jgi:hypothetical protein
MVGLTSNNDNGNSTNPNKISTALIVPSLGLTTYSNFSPNYVSYNNNSSSSNSSNNISSDSINSNSILATLFLLTIILKTLLPTKQL